MGGSTTDYNAYDNNEKIIKSERPAPPKGSKPKKQCTCEKCDCSGMRFNNL